MSTTTVTSVNSAAVATTLIAADEDRVSLVLENSDNNRLYVLVGSGTVSASNYTFSLVQGASAYIDAPEVYELFTGIWDADGSGACQITATVTESATAFRTYSGLKTQIAAWMNRSDLTSQIPEFIRLAEDNLILQLETSDMETSAAVSITSQSVSVPSGLTSVLAFAVATDARPYTLQYEPLDRLLSRETETGNPRFYTRRGSSFLVWPVPDDTLAGTVSYMTRLPVLSDVVTSNWLLTAYPSVYLDAALEQGFRYIRDWNSSARHGALWRDTVDKINRDTIEQIDAGLAMLPSTGTVI